MINSDKVSKILYGGDYNPEQWDEEVWAEDMRLFKIAHIDVVTLNVFSWASLQPSENEYDFSKLDKIMNMVRENGLKVCMATSTAAHPAWMARKYPDILRVENNGMKRAFGARHNSCPNSPTYRKYSVALATKIAERYKDYENIVAWHVSNEYGGECFCENCAKAFRNWLKAKYCTIDNVNRAWNTSFWSHTFYDFEEIVPSDFRSEEFPYWVDGSPRTNFQGITLDYKRFLSDSMLDCFILEKDALKKVTPHIPVTTNFMGWYKGLDYNKWAKNMDFVSWDNYPESNADPSFAASFHDVVRGMKDGMPFCLMEQSPSVSNWHQYCKIKRPGVMRLLSYQAVAHGSDTVMFFQMRQSQGACEKYHSAVISHAGHENTRLFKELTALGEELDIMGGQTLGTTISSKVAIIMDWENWWAAEMSAGPSKLINYISEIQSFYKALFDNKVSVDFVRTDSDFSKYSLVIGPLLYMNKEGFDEKIREYVNNGGCYITTYFSGYVDENDRVLLGGFPGKQKDILGIWVEESDALPPEENNSFIYKGNEYVAGTLCDIMHPEGAEEISVYTREFYAGTPVITKNKFGKGTVYYIGTHSEDAFYSRFLSDICKELSINPICDVPREVEVTMRENEKSRFYFFLNHGETPKEINVPEKGTDIISNKVYSDNDILFLNAKDVVIIKKDK